jgi:hypothetical protein
MTALNCVSLGVFFALILGCDSSTDTKRTPAPHEPNVFTWQVVNQLTPDGKLLRSGSLCLRPQYVTQYSTSSATLLLYWPSLDPVKGSPQKGRTGLDVIWVFLEAEHPGNTDYLLKSCGDLLPTAIHETFKECSRNSKVSPQGNRSYFVTAVPGVNYPLRPIWMSCGPSPLSQCRSYVHGRPGAAITVDLKRPMLKDVPAVYRELLALLECPPI